MSQGSPPVLDYDVDMIEPPRWPKAVGITSIALGALFLGCAGCGVVGLVIQQTMGAQAQAGAQGPPGMTGPAQFANMGLGAMRDIILIVAGSLTVSRKSTGRYLHLAYGIFALLVFGFGIWVAIGQNAAFEQWMRENPENPGVKFMKGPIGAFIKYIS